MPVLLQAFSARGLALQLVVWASLGRSLGVFRSEQYLNEHLLRRHMADAFQACTF